MPLGEGVPLELGRQTLYNDCQNDRTTAIAHHVSFAQITCTSSGTRLTEQQAAL